VWGGVTGSRSSWLKKDGKRFETTLEEASDLALDLTKKRANHPTASFLYTPQQIGENNGL
jgi:hypothetical protein